MLIRRFLMYFADFRASLSRFQIKIAHSFVEMNFFIEKSDKKWRKLELFFLIFFRIFSFFFLFFRQVSSPIMTYLLFCQHLNILLAERNCFLDLYDFVILKILLTFSSFLVQVVFQSFFS